MSNPETDVYCTLVNVLLTLRITVALIFIVTVVPMYLSHFQHTLQLTLSVTFRQEAFTDFLNPGSLIPVTFS